MANFFNNNIAILVFMAGFIIILAAKLLISIINTFTFLTNIFLLNLFLLISLTY